MEMKLTGTREWADQTINIADGCEHDCRYCYAREMKVERFKQVKAEDWSKMKVDFNKVNKSRSKINGVVMMFSAHDWTESILNDAIVTLKRVLDAGNNVLIVSKPHWAVITVLCNVITEYKNQVEFRFTIGSTSNDVLGFWERNAPTFQERLSCLQYAFEHGYKTSVSCEPFLDAYVKLVYDTTIEYITESFWIGMLNKFDQRCQLEDATPEQIGKYVLPLKACYTKTMMKLIYFQMKNRPKVRWKDSYQEFIDKLVTPLPRIGSRKL